MFHTTADLLVPLTLLSPSPTNPRTRFPQAKLDGMDASIQEHGVLQPILARPKPGATSGDPPLEIVAGERRFRACSQATAKGKNPHGDRIPCLVRDDLTDAQVLAMQLVENIQREDLHPLDEAEHYRRMREDPVAPASVADIAAVAKVPEKRVVDRLQLLKLVPAAREAFEAEKLSLRTAFMVACMPEPLQAEATQHLANWGGEPMGPKAARAFIRERYMLRLAQAPFDPADAALKPDAGSCEACPKRTGASPQLFDDIADGDTCTDPSCFAAKRMLHREQQVAQLRGEGYTVMQGEAAEEACSADGRALKPGLHALEEMVPFHLGDNTLKVLDVMERAKAPAEDTRVVDHPSSPTLHFAVSTARLEAALRKIKAHRTQIDAKKPAAPAPAPAPKPAKKAAPAAQAEAADAAAPAAAPAPAAEPVGLSAEQLEELLQFRVPPTVAGLYNGQSAEAFSSAKRQRAVSIITAVRIAKRLQTDNAEGLPPFGLGAMLATLMLYGENYLNLEEIARACGIETPEGALDNQIAWLWKLPAESANRIALVMLAVQESTGDGDIFARFPTELAKLLEVDVFDVEHQAKASVDTQMQLSAIRTGKTPAAAGKSKPAKAGKPKAKPAAKAPARKASKSAGKSTAKAPAKKAARPATKTAKVGK